MKSVFVKMALEMLKNAVQAAVTADKVDAVLDAMLERVSESAASLLKDWPDLLASFQSLVAKAKEGQAVAEALVTALNAVLDALTMPFSAPPERAPAVEALGSAADDLTKLQSALYEPSDI